MVVSNKYGVVAFDCIGKIWKHKADNLMLRIEIEIQILMKLV